MRVLFVITDLYLGGSPRMLRDLALGLKEHHFSPMVVSLKPLPPEGKGVVEELNAGGVEVRSLELNSVWQLWQGSRRLKKIIKNFAPEIVFSILVHANILTALAKPFPAKWVQSIHTLQEKPAWHWTLTRIIARYADAIVVPSPPISAKIRHNSAKVIPNGVNVRRFSDAKKLEKLPWLTESKVVGYVGRFDPVKNLPLLVRSVARMNDTTHLALVGYGPEEERLKKLAGELKIQNRVHFPGPTHEPERWYKSFNCHCLPSTSEGFGLTLAESIAAGTPVVAVRTPVTEEIVRHGIDGLLIDRPDEELLTLVLQEVMDMKEVVDGREYVERNFSTERMVERYAIFLEKI